MDYEEPLSILDKILEDRREKWIPIQGWEWEDFKQSVFLHVFNKFPQYDQKSDLKSWLTRIVYRQMQARLHILNYKENQEFEIKAEYV